MGGLLARDFFETFTPRVSMFGQLKFKIWGQNSKNCGFFLMANFWWSILAVSKIDAIPTFTTSSLTNIYSFKALPLAAYFYSLCRELRVFCLMWSKSGEMIIFSIVSAAQCSVVVTFLLYLGRKCYGYFKTSNVIL